MRSGLSREEVAANKAQVRDFFAYYYYAYHELVRGGSDDFEMLLDFFAVPMAVTTRETHLVLKDGPAVIKVFADNIRRLRAQNYERSIPARSDFRVLNDRACWAEVDWVRTSRMGQEISRLQTAYLVVRTDDDLRISHLVVLGEPPEDARAPQQSGGA